MKNKFLLPSVGFEPSTSCIRGKRLTARPQGPHGREQTTPRLILNTLKVFSLQRHPPENFWHREETSGIDSISKNQTISIKCRHV